MEMEPPPHPGVDPPDAASFDAFQSQLNEEIHRLIAAPTPPPVAPWNTSSSFTALLELDPSQAAKLLHPLPGNFQSMPIFGSSKVKTEAVTENPAKSSDRVASDPTVESNGRSAAKRKDREQKARGSSKKKKKKNGSSQDGVILPYVHVRARRGEATDSHSLAERARREKINVRMKLLQELVPGCNKITGTALVLDEIINHVQSLQRQVELLSMKLAAVHPQIDFNLDNLSAPERFSSLDSDFPIPPMWPEIQFSGNREQYQQQWHYLSLQPSVLGKEEATSNVAPEISYLTYDCSANSGITSNLCQQIYRGNSRQSN